MKNIFFEMSKEIYDKASQAAKKQGITVLDYVRMTMANKVGYEHTNEEPTILNNSVKLDFPVSDELHQRVKEFIEQERCSKKELAEKCINEYAISRTDNNERTFAFKLTENEQFYMKSQLRQRGMMIKEYVSKLIKSEMEEADIKQSEIITDNRNCTKTLSFSVSSEFFDKIKEYLEILGISQQNLVRSLIRKDLNFIQQNDEQEVQENAQSIGMRL